MCGIAGVFYQRAARPEQAAKDASETDHRLAHRGPDGRGFLFLLAGGQTRFCLSTEEIRNSEESIVGFILHRRLAILDTSDAGQQPFHSASRKLWLAHNGEIFNYRELRGQIKDVSWRSQTDTEVLAEWLERKGENAAEHLDGFFAFAALSGADVNQPSLLLVRDRTGVKPLSYVHNEQVFAFASEPKALLPFCTDTEINEQVVFRYLVNGRQPTGGQTWWNQIKSLEPGHFIRYQPRHNRIEKRAWFDPGTVAANAGKARVSQAETEAAIRRSVKSRLISDVPIGFAGSGGIDSSLLAAVALQEDSELKNPWMFSANSGVAPYDEDHWQEMVALHLEARRNRTDVRPEELGFWHRKISWHADAPLSGWNNLAHFLMCRNVNQAGVKVLFNGQGADELMAGYVPYLAGFAVDRGWQGMAEMKRYASHLPVKTGELQMMVWKTRWMRAGFRPSKPLLMWRKPWLKWIRQEMLDRHFTQQDAYQPWPQPLEQWLVKDYFGSKLGQMLHWEDRNSMAWGIESRNPFADDIGLASLLLSVPATEKIVNGWTKYPLRKMAEGLLPRELQWRKDKKGFSMPMIEWNRAASDYLLPLTESPLLHRYTAGYRNLKRMLGRNNYDEHSFLFRVASLAVFLELNEGGFRPQ